MKGEFYPPKRGELTVQRRGPILQPGRAVMSLDQRGTQACSEGLSLERAFPFPQTWAELGTPGPDGPERKRPVREASVR